MQSRAAGMSGTAFFWPLSPHLHSTFAHSGPPTVLPFGEHALTCLQAAGDTQRRHNTLAASIRDCAAAAGWSAPCAAGQVFDSHQGRPADVWVECHPKFRAGVTIDCTIVSAAAQDCNDVVSRREHRKADKYRDEVARHPHL